MCCKVEEYKPYLELFEKVQLDSVHFDIMDGAYVKNVMLGTPIYKDIKRLSKLPVDVHIMSYRPEEYMEYYDIQPGDRISFHPETTAQPYKLLQTIRDKGCKAGLVLNPGTPVSYLEECMDLLDYVTLMTVNPGFAGQKMVPDAPQKIRRVRQLLDAYEKEIDIVVDGNTTIGMQEPMHSSWEHRVLSAVWIPLRKCTTHMFRNWKNKVRENHGWNSYRKSWCIL